MVERMTANDIRDLRKRLGMTQEQLAEALDVSVATVQNYEGGRTSRRRPVAKVIELACEALLARLANER